jgi:dienelactone hydrolase
MRCSKWIVSVLLLIVISGCTATTQPPAAQAVMPTLPRLTVLPSATPSATSTSAPTETATATSQPTSTPQPTSTTPPSVEPPPSSPETPIESATPEIINTLLPGDGSLQPIGQHAYTIDLDVADAKGLTRTATISYLLYLPRAYGQDSAQTWPLILFLHGSGENGIDPELVAANGLPQLLTGDADYPFIVVSPQAQGEDDWNRQLRPLMALVDYVQSNYAVDVKRTYLTGLSMGGIGAWDLALNYPLRFAAAVPIAGGWIFGSDAIPQRICDLKNMPLWVFHGAQDENILPKQSQLLVNALKQCGSDVRFTLYPDANHSGAWTRAYADPALYEWLLAQQLP